MSQCHTSTMVIEIVYCTAADCRVILVTEMTYYVSSGTLNFTFLVSLLHHLFTSLDWVLSHWACFTVHRFICVYLCVFCVFLFCTS